MVDERELMRDKGYKTIICLGGGTFGTVYLAEKINNSNEKYAVKILKKEDKNFNYKIPMFNKILDLKSPYINKMIEYGEIKIKGEKEEKRQYIVYEYAPNGTLQDYLTNEFSFLEDKYVKIIFKNIAKGIQVMHNNNLCHRDIKLDNILLGPNFIPIICDFGTAFDISEKNKLIEMVGTIGYMAPEIMKIIEFAKENKDKPHDKEWRTKRDKLRYDGKKVDIFSLGITLLMILTQKKYPFKEIYGFFQDNKIDLFFEEVNKLIKNIPLDAENLIKDMINYNPIKRPDINEVLNNKWLTDIDENDLNLLKELNIEFNNRKIKIEKKNENRTININQNKNQNIEFKKNKSSSINKGNYFEENFDLEFIDDNKINIKEYIKINGFLEPKEFMNLIVENIKDNENDIKKNDERELEINEDNNYYKFKIILKNEEDEEEDEEEEEIDSNLKDLKEYEEKMTDYKQFINKKALKIEVTLFKSINGYHILIFNKIFGEKEDYYNKLETIISIIKNSK